MSHEKRESIFGMQQVNSRNHVGEWRSPEALSEGASEALVKTLAQKRSSQSLRQNPDQDVDCSYVCSLVEDLMWCISELNPHADISLSKAEDWAIFLHSILTQDTRAFHGIAHVFKIGAGASPLQLLAAFFRDVISHYIDGLKLSKREKRLLADVFREDTMILSADLSDPRDLVVVEIFGYALGADLSDRKKNHGGLDIFLSTILVNRLLGDVLMLSDVAMLATCLEGTIPFRSPDENGKTPFDNLFDRLVDCNSSFELELTHEQMVLTVQQAVDLHNRVLGNMASGDLAEFLNHTWRLLPEQHGALRQHALYTLTDYYQAIQSMVTVIGRLKPGTVFLSYRGLPSDREIQRFRGRFTANLATARIYLRARLLSVAIVSALACLTGGDSAPKSFFFGDLPTPQRKTTALGESLLMSLEEQPDDDVYKILCGAGMRQNGFDTPHAPLAAYLYCTLRDKGITDLLTICNTPMTTEGAWRVIRGLPKDVTQAVALELGRFAVSRKRRIDRFLAEFQMTG